MTINLFGRKKETFWGIEDFVEKVASGENVYKSISSCKQKHGGRHGYKVEGRTYQGNSAHASEKWVTEWTGSVPGDCPVGWKKTGSSIYDKCSQRNDTKCKQQRNLNGNILSNRRSCCIEGIQSTCPLDYREGINGAACDKVKNTYCNGIGKGTVACGCINMEPNMGGVLTRCFGKKCDKSKSLQLYEWKYSSCPNWVSCSQQVNISDNQKLNIGKIKLEQNCGFDAQGGKKKDQLPPSLNPSTTRAYHAIVDTFPKNKKTIIIVGGVSIAVLLLMALLLSEMNA